MFSSPGLKTTFLLRRLVAFLAALAYHILTSRPAGGAARASRTKMANDDGAYRNQHISVLREQYRDLERHIDRLQEDQRRRGWMQDEETASQDKVINNCLEGMNQITQEIERQRQEKNRREDKRNRREGPDRTAARGVGSALGKWLNRGGQPPPAAINLNWEVDGRKYSARYYTDSDKLEVSMVVPPGTPRARQRGTRHLLACNTPEEHQAAIRANES